MRRMSGIWLLAACLLPAQDSGPVFRAGVSLVRVDVAVDGARVGAAPLEAGDFVVRDNGRPQTLRHLEREETPLDIILLFDISGSMQPGVTRVAAGARAALAELREGDRVAVVAFSSFILPLLDFTGDLEHVREVVEGRLLELPFAGGTPLRGAIHELARRFGGAPAGERRRALLAITDNRGQSAGAELRDIIDDLWRADVVVSGLVLGMPGGPSRVFPIGVTRGAREAIHQAKYGASMDPLAEATGGEMVYTSRPERDFQNLLHRLRQRYSLYYAAPEGQAGERRTLEVELTREARRRLGRVQVRARPGYLMPGTLPPFSLPVLQ